MFPFKSFESLNKSFKKLLIFQLKILSKGVSHPLNQIKMTPNWPKCALNTLREISSRSLVWLSKSWASACKFQIHVVVFGPFANVLEKCPGFGG